jgi:beta-glucosidase
MASGLICKSSWRRQGEGMHQNAPKCIIRNFDLNSKAFPKRRFSLTIAGFALALGFAVSTARADDAPAIYKDKSQPVEARVEDLLKRLTPEEKIDMLSGINGFDVRPIERLGVPLLHMSDGPCGTRNDGPTTAYPSPVALAASWDVDLAKRFGTSIGRDARARGVHFLLAPAVNIYRVPQNGRNFEYLGEDPYLAAHIVAPIIQGVQSQGVAATVKHFAANNQEFERMTISSEVDLRTLNEIYLPAFKAAVQEGHVWAAMCAYNRLNGEFCSANQWLLTDTLKKSWGFTGVMMSDWGAVHDTLGPINAGLDLEMPSGKYINRETVQPLLDSGKVTWATLDDKCRRILRVAFTMGAFERPQKDESIPLDDPTSDATALQVAREGIVLLKNENHTLPLDRAKIKTIAVVGPNADPAITGGGGSSYTHPTRPVSVFEGIKRVGWALPTNSKEVGDAHPTGNENPKILHVSTGIEKKRDELIKASNFGEGLSGEFFKGRNLEGEPVVKRTDTKLDFDWSKNPPEGMPRENYSARWTGKINVEKAGTYLFVLESDDGSRAFLDGKEIINLWSNHRAQLREKTVNLTPGAHDVRVEYYQSGKDASLRFGWGVEPPLLDDDAKKQLASADAVVLCAGFSPETEGEGSDRTFALPYPQAELIQAVAAINPHTTLVLNAGGNVESNSFRDKVPAIVQAWYPGQAGGTALAEILFGDVNPSGKLPATFEKRFEDNAAFGQVSYPGEAGQVNYHEGIFVGYRHFDRDNIEPSYCFGHGLSYTTFKYSNLQLHPIEGTNGASFEASVDITNTGHLAGAEVAQLYVRQLQCSVPRPVRELKGFARVDLKAGDTKTVKIILNRDAFSYFSMSANGWVVDPGEFEIAVGGSSRDLPLKQSVQIK